MEGARHAHVQHHGVMVRRALVQHLAGMTGQPAGDAAVQPQRHDIAGAVGALARPDVGKALQPHRTHGVEVTDDGGGALQLLDDVTQLEAVQELAMAEMHIGKGDAVEADQLGKTRRHPAGQDRGRKADGAGLRKRMRAPGGQAIDARLHGMAEEMPAHQRRQRGDVLSAFLQQQQVWMGGLYQPGDVVHARAGAAKQIPAHHAQPAVGKMSRCHGYLTGELGTGFQSNRAGRQRHKKNTR